MIMGLNLLTPRRRPVSKNQSPQCLMKTQTKEFEYMFSQATYQAPDREYFKLDDKVRFYTGLPSYEVLMVIRTRFPSRVTQIFESGQFSGNCYGSNETEVERAFSGPCIRVHDFPFNCLRNI